MSSGVFLSHSESYLFQIIDRFLTGKINRSEAAQLLNLSERSITRHAKKIKDKGIFGAKHGNFGKTPNKKYPDSLKKEVLDLFQREYYDFNLTHFSEILKSKYKIDVNYKTLWIWFKEKKFIKNP